MKPCFRASAFQFLLQAVSEIARLQSPISKGTTIHSRHFVPILNLFTSLQSRLIREEAAALVEVLPTQEFEDENIQGAINIPLEGLNRENTSHLGRARPGSAGRSESHSCDKAMTCVPGLGPPS